MPRKWEDGLSEYERMRYAETLGSIKAHLKYLFDVLLVEVLKSG